MGLISCQTENSSSQDAEQYSDIGGHPGFAAARAILSQNCAKCHSYNTMSEDELVQAGVLVLGDAANSPLYYRLVGSTKGGGPKTMPPGGALSISDLNKIETWIDGAN